MISEAGGCFGARFRDKALAKIHWKTEASSDDRRLRLSPTLEPAVLVFDSVNWNTTDTDAAGYVTVSATGTAVQQDRRA